MGRGVGSTKLHGSRGSLRARAQRMLAGEPEPSAEDKLQRFETHYVTELAQELTEECFERAAWILRGAPDADGVPQAKVSDVKGAIELILAWGWVKPHQQTARPIGNDGGRGITLQIVQVGEGGTTLVKQFGGPGEESKHDPDHPKLPTPAEAALQTGVEVLPPG